MHPIAADSSSDTLSIGARMSRLFAAAILAPWPSGAVAAAQSVGDQLWSELDATYPIAAAWSATGILTTRLGNSLPNPTLSAGGLQIDYRFGSWIASGTGYYVSIRTAQSGARTRVAGVSRRR